MDFSGLLGLYWSSVVYGGDINGLLGHWAVSHRAETVGYTVAFGYVIGDNWNVSVRGFAWYCFYFGKDNRGSVGIWFGWGLTIN